MWLRERLDKMGREKNGAELMLRVRRNKKSREEYRRRVAKGKTKQDEYREE